MGTAVVHCLNTLNNCSTSITNQPTKMYLNLESCWWPGNARCQDISNRDMESVYVEYSRPCSTRVDTLRPRQHARHFADDTFKRIFLNENIWISLKISLMFVSKVPIDNIPALVQVMAWHRPGDKPLSEAMMVSLLTHICVSRPQWVNNGEVEYNSDFVLTKDFPYITLTGELQRVLWLFEKIVHTITTFVCTALPIQGTLQ